MHVDLFATWNFCRVSIRKEAWVPCLPPSLGFGYSPTIKPNHVALQIRWISISESNRTFHGSCMHFKRHQMNVNSTSMAKCKRTKGICAVEVMLTDIHICTITHSFMGTCWLHPQVWILDLRTWWWFQVLSFHFPGRSIFTWSITPSRNKTYMFIWPVQQKNESTRNKSQLKSFIWEKKSR